MALSRRTVTVLKPFVFLLCLVPLLKVVLEAFAVAGLSLGANPVEELIHRFGIWGLNFLLITLSVTPLRRLSGQVWLLRFRRMFGLFAFFYAFLHFLSYAVVDQRLDFAAIFEDIVERPYITLGMTALFLLIPLAVTSTKGMMRRLGRRWHALHRLVYVIAPLGAWHFWWQVKKDTSTVLVYIAILALLLGFRFFDRQHKKRRSRIG
jgi:sulfoxide reductase heme-binding subunit YedZ